MTQLRAGTLADVPFLVRCQISHAQEVEHLALDTDTVERGVRAVLTGGEDKGFYLVAETLQGEGAGCLLVLREWSDWRAAWIWWIHSVYVVPQFRGQRLFDDMYQWVKKKAEESGARGLRLYVDKGNSRAQKIYARLGMSRDHYELFEVLFP